MAVKNNTMLEEIRPMDLDKASEEMEWLARKTSRWEQQMRDVADVINRMPSNFLMTQAAIAQDRTLAASTAVAEMPDPTQIIPSSDKEETERYAALACRLGVHSPEMLERRLEHVLADECIRVYDLQKVRAYMQQMLEKERITRNSPYLIWNWVPLRKQDSPIPAESASMTPMRWLRNNRDPWAFIPFVDPPPPSGPYTKPIPYPVLETIDKIVERMGPENVEFYVTDYQVKDPDPFLAVRAKGCDKLFVIERWDEPSFRG